MEHEQINDAILKNTIHIADLQTKMVEYQTRMAEALVTINANIIEHQARMTDVLTASQARIAESETRTAEAYLQLGRILDRVIETTDRTEQMTSRILAGLAPDKVSH